jgi:hypothetical protein
MNFQPKKSWMEIHLLHVNKYHQIIKESNPQHNLQLVMMA